MTDNNSTIVPAATYSQRDLAIQLISLFNYAKEVIPDQATRKYVYVFANYVLGCIDHAFSFPDNESKQKFSDSLQFIGEALHGHIHNIEDFCMAEVEESLPKSTSMTREEHREAAARQFDEIKKNIKINDPLEDLIDIIGLLRKAAKARNPQDN